MTKTQCQSVSVFAFVNKHLCNCCCCWLELATFWLIVSKTELLFYNFFCSISYCSQIKKIIKLLTRFLVRWVNSCTCSVKKLDMNLLSWYFWRAYLSNFVSFTWIYKILLPFALFSKWLELLLALVEIHISRHVINKTKLAVRQSLENTGLFVCLSNS